MLQRYKDAFGVMTSTEALAIAVESEQMTKHCGPSDPASAYFNREQRAFEHYAELLEKEEQVHKE